MSEQRAGQVGEPLVTVGLPVYNGDRYLADALQSLVDQTYDNMEIIVSDNASTDDSRDICQQFAAKDGRIRLHRQPENVGAAANFNTVLDLASGEFFKWMAHDDVCEPRFIEACLHTMLEDPTVALAYPTPLDIDVDGHVIGHRDHGLGFDGEDPAERFRSTMRTPHRCLPVFGLMRTSTLRRTLRHGDFPAADRVLISEMALHGRIVEVPEPLFLHREHSERFSISHKTIESQIEWFDPSQKGKLRFPTWRRLAEYLRAIGRSPIGIGSKASCLVWMVRWTVSMRSRLYADLVRVMDRRTVTVTDPVPAGPGPHPTV